MSKPNIPGVTKYKTIKEALRDIAKECRSHHEKMVEQLKAKAQVKKR